MTAHGSALVAEDAGAPAWLWRNGELVPWQEARIHVNAVGHASVAAVFEGIKAYRADEGPRLLAFRLDEHLDRLYASARINRLSVPFAKDDLRAAVADVVRANRYADDVYVRPWIFPSGVIREQMVPEWAPCEVVIDTWPFRSDLEGGHGCSAAVGSWLRAADTVAPPRVKAFANYHGGRMALMEARRNGHDWPIMLNERQKVSESAASCVALVLDGTVVAPEPTGGLLPGITRDTVLTLLADAGTPVVEREVDRTELYLASEVFLMGTAWEVLPVTSVDGLEVGGGRPGPVATGAARRYRDAVRGADPRRKDWLTEIPGEEPCAR